MKVLKFGGTSVGTPSNMKQVAKVVSSSGTSIVVLSAVSGTTNALEAITKLLYQQQSEKARIQMDALQANYVKFVEELFSTDAYKDKGRELIVAHFNHLRSFTRDLFTTFEERAILAQGELLSTALFHYYLEEEGESSVFLPALDFMRIDKDAEPDMWYIETNLKREMEKHRDATCFITQGYICRNAYGEIDNLKRGGSDYTASLIGAVLRAEEIQIWTDIDGMHNNDPRMVDNTTPVRSLSFDEAAELAYFGAKILHPSSIRPARDRNVPVRLKNTMEPEAEGTLITENAPNKGIRAVAAKDGIVAVKIRSGRMLMAYGFLRRVFEVFERHKTSIDMITTSEVAVSLTIDDDQRLADIEEEILQFGSVEVDRNQVIICIVGDILQDKKGVASKVFEALSNVPIRMISYGGSNNNISLLVDQKHKKEALVALNEGLFTAPSA